MPNWIEVEELPWKEKCEIQFYKLVSLVPVSVTFCLYIYIFVYYIVVSETSYSLAPFFVKSATLLMCDDIYYD